MIVPAPLLNEIRITVVDAYYSVPRGGVEVGGVFFGTLSEATLEIRVCRPITCQYLTGPSFKLSDEDRLNVPAILNLPSSDPKFAGLVPLGWYHSHTRSAIFLSPDDLRFHREFFPESWQIALVLRPVHLQPTRAGFFFRDRSDNLKSDAPCQEFIMEPPMFGLALSEDTLDETPAPVPEPSPKIRVISPPPEPDVRPEILPPLPRLPLLTHGLARSIAASAQPLPAAPPLIQEEPPAPGKTGWADRWRRIFPPMQPPTDSDRRTTRRLSGDGLLAFYWDGNCPFPHRVRDISWRGAFVETDFTWMCGTLLDITLQIKSEDSDSARREAILIPAVIVRTTFDGMAIKFLPDSLNHVPVLLHFLSRWNAEIIHEQNPDHGTYQPATERKEGSLLNFLLGS